MKQLVLPSVAVAAVLLLSADRADAGGVWGRLSSSGHHHHQGHGIHEDLGYHGEYGLRRVQLRRVQLRHVGPRYTPSSAPYWHDTSHLHWHPGEWQWCHGQRVYVPGHYDVHRTGHWDY